MPDIEIPRISIPMQGGSQFHIAGLTKDEVTQMEAWRHSAVWTRVVDGRLEVHPAYLPLPAMQPDPHWLPGWATQAGQQKHFEFEPLEAEDLWSPAIYLHGLCAGYHYPDWKLQHEKEAAKLTRWGFEVLRSGRHENGQYTEVWQLGWLFSARDELRAAIDAAPEATKPFTQNPKAKAAVDFLCREIHFGAVCVTAQRACLVYD